MSSLVIVESPAKCQKIQSYLGNGWKVIASLGHIRGLTQDLDFLQANYEPKYEYLKEKGKAIAQLKEAAKESTTIYLAADRDFEGEQIAYSVCLLLKLNPKKTHRITFTEITEKAVKNAIQNPGLIDMNRVYTQQSRSMLDILIGFTMSPLLWRHVAPSLSAGRCQMPSLRLVVERENTIKDFKVSSSWKLDAIFATNNNKLAHSFKACMEDELEDEESAQNYMEMIYETPQGKIISKISKPWTESAPQPLITSTLQQQASAMYHINPKNTMKIAQRLYEAGHITYMRTDKAILSEEATIEAIKFVEKKYGAAFVKEESKEDVINLEKQQKQQKQKQGNAQEAHEAIRPTNMEIQDIEGDAYDKKVYRLIWQRTIQSVMSEAKGEICKIRIQIDNDTDFTWRSEWKRTTFEGWKCAGKVVEIDDQNTTDITNSVDAVDAINDWSITTQLQVGDTVSWNKMYAQPKDTKAQGRYTEATLVRELEKHGIGRPSTFASLLSVIQDKNYVELIDIPAKDTLVKEYMLLPQQYPPSVTEHKRKMGAEKNKLVPTELGRSVLAFMMKHFDDLFAYGFTAQMEKRLDAIAEGKDDWKQIIKSTWESYKDRYEALLKGASSNNANNIENKPEKNARMKEFQGRLKAIQTKKGPLLLIEGETKEDTQFLGWPKGIIFEDMTEELAESFKNTVKEQHIVGEWNNNPIHKKSGKFGDYLQCGSVSITCIADESYEKMIERFEAKQGSNGVNGVNGANGVKEFKNYTIRTGQYGPYIIKTSVKKAVFVSLPKDINLETLTEKEVDAIYKAGSEAKKKYVKK